MGSERRRFTRSAVRIPVRLTVGDSVGVEGALRDLSLAGLSVEVESALSVGTRCGLCIVLDEELTIEGTASVVRTAPGEDGILIGLALEGVDLDSLPHLRRLVQYNAKDPDQVEDEAKTVVGIKPT